MWIPSRIDYGGFTHTLFRWDAGAHSPCVHALNAYYHRSVGFDQAVFTRRNDALVKALQGGCMNPRNEHRLPYADTLIRSHIVRSNRYDWASKITV